MEDLTQQINNDLKLFVSELLKQSKTDLDNNLQKAIRLKNIGFINSSETKILKKSKVNEYEILIPFIAKYYKRNYPFLRFITEAKLKELCRKYRLVYAPVSNYVGTVPDKNLIEIENAQLLLEKDRPAKRYFIKVIKFWDENKSDCYISPQVKKYLKNWVEYHGDIRNWNEYWQEGESVTQDVSNDLQQKLGLTEKQTWFICLEDIVKEAYLSELYVCAPQNNFTRLNKLIKEDNNSYYDTYENHETFMSRKRRISVAYLDPIVFRFCKEGIQILSKWGKESTDKEFINPIEN